MSILVWAMVGIALWHFAVLVPDHFWGGIIGAFLAALLGAMLSGYLLPVPGLPSDNPPGIAVAVWAIPGSVAALVFCYWHGLRREARWEPLATARHSTDADERGGSPLRRPSRAPRRCGGRRAARR